MTLGIVFLYGVVGASVLIRLAVVVVLLPVPGWFTARIRDVEWVRMRLTDERIEGISEVIALLRMLKLFGWKSYIEGCIENKRESELACVRKRRVLELAKGVANKVGRTESGKSTLALALLRSILTTGEVYYVSLRTD
ncbi:hypothetical protein HYPSUDRAFT_1047700 [Hypholoma sublateritium FD-334 SS-4]|uniref:ABC transmembrane type-1 domain-containing protein n=1 Tax=Hypholoma sublateritium (strain FD-334 SS-4) TaxID=945553 RepID=A0A0D2M152_HYPSF|nr:hypothetical protein HYPSUDRAFT_1047700 [Hypholoma sublateritium FD-334 SS-4]